MERIDRIKNMEQALNQCLSLLKQAEEGMEALEKALPLIRQLDEYYSSPLWMQDYHADEKGLIPQDLPRGVLSEDGIYNTFFQYRQLLNHMQKILEEDT